MSAERGEKGDHGQQGERGLPARRSWVPAVAIALFAVIQVLGFGFSKVQADKAIDTVRDEAKHNDERFAQQNEDNIEGICGMARRNATKIVNILENSRTVVESSREGIPEDQWRRSMAFYDRQLELAREPFPHPCEAFSL